LKIRDVTKRFGGFVALNSVSLDIGRGEFVCFLGPSGCGKTTLLRVIAGWRRPTQGNVELDGRDLIHAPAQARNFGVVFQSYSLFPNMTAARNIGYGLECRRRPRAEIDRRVDEMLGIVGLRDHAEKLPAQLSGGQQQRIALARALAPDPQVALLDEPLSALDAKVREDLRLEIRSLQKRLGITTIMVTHDQDEALTMADRIVVMRAGGSSRWEAGMTSTSAPPPLRRRVHRRMNVLTQGRPAARAQPADETGARAPPCWASAPRPCACTRPARRAQPPARDRLAGRVPGKPDADRPRSRPPAGADPGGSDRTAIGVRPGPHQGTPVVAELPSDALQVLEWQ
jgi:ABC-type nitrate/sulfonate/bicarbonate transport system ATPase subunit